MILNVSPESPVLLRGKGKGEEGKRETGGIIWDPIDRWVRESTEKFSSRQKKKGKRKKRGKEGVREISMPCSNATGSKKRGREGRKCAASKHY